MGLPLHTHEMTRRCAAIVGFDAMFFCKILARWVYKNTCTMRCYIGFDALFFCKIVARWVYKKNTHGMTLRCVAIVGFDALFFCKMVARWGYKNTRVISEHGIPDFISFMPALRARNPVFWPKWGIKNRGFSALCDMTRRCVAIVGFDALFFCKMVTRWVYKKHTHETDPEIPKSRFIVYAFKRRFVPVWASLNRWFRGLAWDDMASRCYSGVWCYVLL